MTLKYLRPPSQVRLLCRLKIWKFIYLITLLIAIEMHFIDLWHCYLRGKRGIVTCEGGRGEGEDVAETREEEDGQRPKDFIMIHLWWWWSWKCFYDVSPVEERALYLALEYGVVVLEEKELSRRWSSIISVLDIWKFELHLDSVDGADGGALARWRRHLGGVFGDRWWGPSVVT